MLTDDVIHKVHIGHYTFYHKSVVKQPKNLIIAEDIFAQSYVSGEGASVFEGGRGEGSFTDELGRDNFTRDLIAVWVNADPQTKKLNIANPLDITGFYNPQTLDENNSQLDNTKEHYPGASGYASGLQFDRLQNYGSPDQFLSPMRNLNTVCFQGHQLNFNKDSKKHSDIVINTGHWGPNVYPGCRSVRNGENAFLKDMEYEKYRLGKTLG